MPSKISQRFKLRRDFSNVERSFQIPDLIQIQKNSFGDFINKDGGESSGSVTSPDAGLLGVFKSVFPIKDYNDTASLEFVSYSLGEPKYDELECQERGATFAAPLKVTIQLVIWDVDEDGERQVRDIKEQEVYFGEVPLMTDRGTFVINGTERVIVSQLHRSPGVFFSHDSGKTHATGKLLYSARVIPYRGSWLDLEFDAKDLLYVRIDRKRKQNATILLRALGLSGEEILKEFYKIDILERGKAGKLLKKFNPETCIGLRAAKDIKDGSKTIVKANQKISKVAARRIKDAGIESFEIDSSELESSFIASTITRAIEDVVHPKTGDVLIKAGEIIVSEKELFDRLPNNLASLEREDLEEVFSKIEVIAGAGQEIEPDVLTASGKLKAEGTLTKLNKAEVPHVELLYTKDSHIGDSLAKTLLGDGIEDDLKLVDKFLGIPQDNAAVEIYKRLRPGDPPRVETAKNNFNNLFFNEERYDLSSVGRLKIDFKLHRNKANASKQNAVNTDSEYRATLDESDIIETFRYLLELRAGYSAPGISRVVDDIDHLGNRRVRSVGELVENQFRIGLLRMEKATRERMGAQDIEAAMPQDLINYKPVSAILKEFFGSSQLSQFMDQSNPLSEVTHKRRLSALGPGGLTRERAGFEVRDVHTTHYGRICPIETPEGPNIGLISSMAIYGAINKYGFVVTPYRKVNNGVISDEIQYLTALEEEDEIISQSSVTIDKKGKITDEIVSARVRGEFTRVPASDVTYIDVASDQLVSVATSLIPFLENDDANRALMGSNMQRQAVPLVRTSAPYVGTGMERVVARDSGAAIVAKRDGVVESVDSKRIVIKAKKVKKDGNDTGVDFYPLKKYKRSNQNTCINQRPIVEVGDVVSENEIIADGQSTDRGELALGQNILVAFMPWGGYNFEDSILVSERLVRDDTFTSIHIEEFECVSRDTRMGPEEITRDIPNVGEDDLANLDESGIVRIGAEVKSGCILVGKVTPKSENQLSPEEKLLRAIFGEKAGEVKDTSLRLPPSVEGTVVDCRVFSRQGSKKDERMLEIEQREIEALERNMRDEIRIVRESSIKEITRLTKGLSLVKNLQDEGRKVLVKKGTELTADLIKDIPFEYLKDLNVGDDQVNEKLENIVNVTSSLISDKRTSISNKIKQMKKGDELPPGVVKMVKVFVAVKRKLSVGDKMAGRHGNKGVVSRILPAEDMPYLPDGTPVDMVLNPLGVPSRMNVGQVLETHLGWACTSYGRQIRNILDKYFDPNVSIEKSVTKLDTAVREKLVDECRKHLEIGHPNDDTKQLVESLSDKELMKLVQKEMEGLRVACPVFEAAKEEEIQSLLKKLGLEEYGQTDLFDGRTGEKFKEKVTVGIMYMLKLHHLVDEKIHARSIGPYSLVTQQPLGGKAQFGGQRLGEMEVWALEAYGAAHALQEFLTVKSDDVSGRTRMYESIVKGEHSFEPGLPESLKVMVKELKSLALDVNLIEPEEEIEIDEVEALKAKLGSFGSN